MAKWTTQVVKVGHNNNRPMVSDEIDGRFATCGREMRETEIDFGYCMRMRNGYRYGFI